MNSWTDSPQKKHSPEQPSYQGENLYAIHSICLKPELNSCDNGWRISVMKVQFSNANCISKTNKKSTLQKRIDELNKISNIGETPVQESIQTIVVSVYAEVATTAEVTISFLFNKQPGYRHMIFAPVQMEQLTWHTKLNYGSKAEWIGKMFLLHWYRQPDTIYIKTRIKSFYLSFIESRKNNCSMKSGKRNLRVYQSNWMKKVRIKRHRFRWLQSRNVYNRNRKMMLTEYEIKLKYSIPNDPNNHVVSIQHKNLESKYKYSAVPKMDLNAYLLADIHNWGEINLCPAHPEFILTAIISELQSWIGCCSRYVVAQPGKDRSILVSRKKLKDKTKERVIIDEKSISVTYEIAVRNTKSSPVQLDVTDQIPLSQNPDIKIALLDGDGSLWILKPACWFGTWISKRMKAKTEIYLWGKNSQE